MWSQLWVSWWKETISSLHFLCPYQKKPISADVVRKYDLTSLILIKTHDFFFNTPGMSGRVRVLLQPQQSPNSLCLQPLPPQPECAAAHEAPGTPQLSELRKKVQVHKYRDLELHTTWFLSYFISDLIFICKPAQMQCSVEGHTLFPLPWDRQKDLANATEINSARKTQDLSSSAFKSQIMANRRLNFSPRVHMHHDSLHTPLMLFLSYCSMP